LREIGQIFIKIAPIIHAILDIKAKGEVIDYRLIHTVQHYDKNKSRSFFEELEIPTPNNNLECGGGSQAEQTGNIIIAFEKEL
jgi:UDP-N-acetylglucosamine 2-epimerase (non-hydrolysing)